MKLVEPKTLSGFMELLPIDQIKFNKLYDIIRNTYESFGFLPLDTPIIESSKVLLAKAGGETDKQVYQIKRGDSDLTLRFDLTVPLAKYVAKNYSKLSFPFRRYQIGKVYRGERAQKGRFREFYQADIDIIGDAALDIYNDAEIPFIIYTLFKDLQIGNFVIYINNRKVLNGFFKELGVISESSNIMRIIDKILKIGELKVIEELKNLNLGDDVVKKIISFINIDGPNLSIIDSLKKLNIKDEEFNEGLNELEIVLNQVYNYKMTDENIKINLKISRGLDYYTGTVYETYLIDHMDIGSICSGGRYDNLAECYTKKKLPGVGIAIGLTRLFEVLLNLDLIKNIDSSFVDALIIPLTNNYDYITKVFNELLDNNVKTQIIYDKKSIKSIVNYASNLNINNLIFIGDDEVKNNNVTVKKLKEFSQETMSIKSAIKEIK